MSNKPCLICGSFDCRYDVSMNAKSLACNNCGGLLCRQYAFVAKLQAQVEALTEENERLKKAIVSALKDYPDNGDYYPGFFNSKEILEQALKGE